MKRPRKAVGTAVLLGGGLAAVYLFREPLSRLFQPQQRAAGSDPIAQVLDTVLGQLNKSLDNLRNPESEERQGLRNLDEARRSVFAALGLGEAPGKREARNKQLAQASLAERIAAERYARSMHSDASRKDVREWKITSEGYVIFYEGRSSPFVRPVPVDALHPRAWVLEAPARILATPSGGAVPQAELGPFGVSIGQPGTTKWINYDEPAFSDNNPAAPRDWTIQGLHDPPTFGTLPAQEGNNA